MELNARNVVLTIFKLFQTLTGKVQVFGSYVAADCWDCVELEKHKQTIIGFVSHVVINLRCDEWKR